MTLKPTEELASLALRDPLAWGIAYFDLLENRQWEVSTRKWAIEPYQVLNPWRIEKYPIGEPRRVAITKSTQAGISTTAMVKSLHFATNWPVRIGYTLPRQQDTIDFVSTRFDPSISASPFLKGLLGEPNSLHAKRIGRSYIFFLEMSTEPRMLPLDALYVDEIDLSNPDNLSTLLNRMDASPWKLTMYLSTPTVPNYGIHGLYSSSDMREWLVKCPHCGHEQHIDWDENLRVEGPQNKPTRVFYGCIKCNQEITVEDMQGGRWVAQHPDLSGDFAGFHIHQMLTTPAPILYNIFRDPQTKLVEFYRKRLGKPYEIGGGSLERDDILAACFDAPYEPEGGHDGRSVYYLGVDQGNELQVLIAKIERGSRRKTIVHTERIPMDKGFTRLGQLMSLYRIRKAVGDGNPNRHSMTKMAKDFPGRFLVADYIEEQKVFWKTKKGLTEQPEVISHVTINRTLGLDTVVEDIKAGAWQLPGTPPGLDPEIELVIDQVTAIKRDVETRRTPSGEQQVAVWRKLRADHMAHAWLYLLTAIEIDHGKGLRVIVVNSDASATAAQDSATVETSIYQGIVALLAEVPVEQLIDFIRRQDEENYTRPFPLSFKLRLVEEQFPGSAIIPSMLKLIEEKAGKVLP